MLIETDNFVTANYTFCLLPSSEIKTKIVMRMKRQKLSLILCCVPQIVPKRNWEVFASVIRYDCSTKNFEAFSIKILSTK